TFVLFRNLSDLATSHYITSYIFSIDHPSVDVQGFQFKVTQIFLAHDSVSSQGEGSVVLITSCGAGHWEIPRFLSQGNDRWTWILTGRVRVVGKRMDMLWVFSIWFNTEGIYMSGKSVVFQHHEGISCGIGITYFTQTRHISLSIACWVFKDRWAVIAFTTFSEVVVVKSVLSVEQASYHIIGKHPLSDNTFSHISVRIRAQQGDFNP